MTRNVRFSRDLSLDVKSRSDLIEQRQATECVVMTVYSREQLSKFYAMHMDMHGRCDETYNTSTATVCVGSGIV